MGDEIVRPCNRHRYETVTVRKYVNKYKKMWKWMVEFLRKFENLGIEIAQVISIISKSINLQFFTLFFVRCWGPL